MKLITAKFNSTCAETLSRIVKGEPMLYDYSTKKCYSIRSQAYKNYEVSQEARSVSDYVQAQEDAYFDNQYRTTGIGY